MNKYLVLSEGKHDTYFFEQVFGNPKNSVGIKLHRYLNLPEAKKFKHNKIAETSAVDSFSQQTSPQKIFFKSEGGKGKVRGALPWFNNRVLKSPKGDFELIIVIDSDDIVPKDAVEALMRDMLVKGNIGPSYTWTKSSIKNFKDYTIHKVDVNSNSDNNLNIKIKIWIFNGSLERLSQINEKDGRSIIESKLNKYSESINKEELYQILFE